MAKKETDANEAAGRGSKTLGEYGEGKGIEKQSENDIINAAEVEKFMNQVLTVVVAKDGTQGSYDVITPNVNGINQSIIRGIPQKIKRKYVEALAHSRVTNYEQETPDPRKPENFEMRDTTVITYPFSVLHDPHPDGAEWLNNLLAQPA